MSGVDFGKHGYAPGEGEELEVKRTLWERVIDYIFPSPWAAEERLALLQLARRIKLKTDIQEARIRKRQAQAEPTSLVAVWRQPFRNSTQTYTAIVELRASRNRREVKLLQCVNAKGGVAKAHPDIWVFLKSRPTWYTYITPWLEGQLSTAQLRRACKDDFTFPATGS